MRAVWLTLIDGQAVCVNADQVTHVLLPYSICRPDHPQTSVMFGESGILVRGTLDVIANRLQVPVPPAPRAPGVDEMPPVSPNAGRTIKKGWRA